MAADLEEQYDNIYRYCYMKVRSRQAAEDITQETFLCFLESRTYREMGRELSYLYTIARNKCIDFYRQRECLPLMEGAGGFKDETERLAVSVTLREAVMKLTEEEQELIFLKYGNELPMGQIGRITGLSRFAVHRRLKQILEKLRKSLGEEEFG